MSAFAIVETRADLQAMHGAWREMAERANNGFLSPEWFGAALGHHGPSASPFVAVLMGGDGGLEAIAPLVREGDDKRSVVRFAGAGLGDSFLPLSTGPGAARELATELGAELAGRRDWRALVLENVPEGASWIEGLTGAGLHATHLPHRDEVLPFASIEGITWEDFLAARSRNFRSQLGRKQRALERDHEVSYRQVEDAGELPGAMNDFERLHHSRWDSRGGSQALTERSRAFHDDFARVALERGWLRLWLLEVDGAPVAAWYGWRVGRTYAYYLAGFDTAWSRASVGLLLQARTVRAAIEEGAARYDLLLGGEEYKARFADGEDRVRTYTVTRRFSPVRAMARAEVGARAAADRLSPELRASLKRRLGGLARRAPSDVRR